MNANEKQIFKTKIKLICEQAKYLAYDMIETESTNDLGHYDLLYACIQYLDESNAELVHDLDIQLKKDFLAMMLKGKRE